VRLLISSSKLGKLVALMSIVCALFATAKMCCGVIYWRKVLPSEELIYQGRNLESIFGPFGSVTGNNAYGSAHADGLSPLLLASLGLPTKECLKSARPSSWRSDMTPVIIQHLRGEGLPAAFFKGDRKLYWPYERLLLDVALRTKYSIRTQEELYVKIIGNPPIIDACERILGHSCRKMSPEEAAVISRWVAIPADLADKRMNLEKLLAHAKEIASRCHESHVPVDRMRIEPSNRIGGLPRVFFVTKPRQEIK